MTDFDHEAFEKQKARMSIETPSISYGVYLEDDNDDNDNTEDLMHHLFDWGVTGAGMAVRCGPSQLSICEQVSSHNMHIYVQAISLTMAKDFLAPKVINDGRLNFCPKCMEIFYQYIKENDPK